MSEILSCRECGAQYRFGEGFLFDNDAKELLCIDCAKELLAELEGAE